MRLKKTRKGTEVTADEVEAAVLRRLVEDLLLLLGAPDEVEQDPLAALVGMPTGEVTPPRDEALARLLPDAYGDDPEASAEFRRYTETDLRAGKRRAAQTVLDTVHEGKVLLDRDQADAWLGCLNDLRLVLGTRLGVTEDLFAEDLPEDDPRLPPLQVYGWLGWLQESLIGTLVPRR